MTKLINGFTLLELVVVMAIIAIVSQGGKTAWQYYQQQSYAQLFLHHFMVYENALSMYCSEHNGALPSTLTTGTYAFNKIPDLIPYLPYNFMHTQLPLGSSFVLSYNSSRGTMSVVLQNIPQKEKRLVDALTHLMTQDAHDDRVIRTNRQGTYTITYVLKNETSSYL